MKHINYKSDFDFFFDVADAEGKVLDFPDFDWSARFYASNKLNAVEASCINGVCTNCFNDNGRIHVVINRPNIGVGALKVELHTEVPDGVFPDGKRDTFFPMPLDIELVPGLGDTATTAEVTATVNALAYLKGDKGDTGEKGDKGEPFTYEDFTPQQIEALKQPAVEAARSAQSTVDNVVTQSQRAVDDAVAHARDSVDAAVAQSQSAVESTLAQARQQVDKVVEDASVAAEQASTAAVSADAAAAKVNGKQDKITVSEDMSLSPDGELSLTDMAKKRLFIDLWNEACDGAGKYNDATGFFELNGLTDITYDQAVHIYNAGTLESTTNASYRYQGWQIRTHLPGRFDGVLFSGASVFDWNGYVEVAGFYWLNPQRACFRGCGALRVATVFTINGYDQTAEVEYLWTGCKNLETITFSNVSYAPIGLQDCPKLGLATFQRIVQLYKLSRVLTVKVHADVYAKLTDESNVEWNKVLTDGIAKQISFVTV